jgi:PAS domain S-box-containing protein
MEDCGAHHEKRLLAANPDALVAPAPDGEVLDWNRGAEATFGYTSEEAVRHSFHPIAFDKDATRDRRS